MWRSWWSMIHHILITHLHIISLYQGIKELQHEKSCLSTVKLEEEKVLLKQYVSLHCFVEGKKLFVHIGHLNLKKTFCLNIQVSLKQAAHEFFILLQDQTAQTNDYATISENWQKSGRKISICTCIQMRVTSSKCTSIL